jgi:hypothetical protein
MLRSVGVTLGPDERRGWFVAKQTAFGGATPADRPARATTPDDFRSLIEIAALFGGEDEDK